MGLGAPTVEYDFSLACDDEGTLGSRSGSRWRYETFTVPSRGLYNLTIVPEPPGEGDTHVSLIQCGTSCFDDDASTAQVSYDGRNTCLEEGTYLMRMKREDGSAGGFYFFAEPVGFC